MEGALISYQYNVFFAHFVSFSVARAHKRNLLTTMRQRMFAVEGRAACNS